MSYSGLPWDNPSLLASQERFFDLSDEWDTAASYREQAIRERDANLGDEQRRLIAELDEFWQLELESRA